MKKLFIGAALSLVATCAVHAADGASPFRFVLGGGLTLGGDTLTSVPFTDGSTRSVKAGSIFAIYGGAEYRLGTAVSLQATVGYQVDDATGSNGSVRFSRYPVDLLAYYHVNDQFRLGGGAQLVNSARLSTSGAGSAFAANTSYDSTTGVVIEGEYLFNPKMGFKVRAVSEKFKQTGTNNSVSGNHLGLLFNYYL